jgi:hypothetical protein
MTKIHKLIKIHTIIKHTKIAQKKTHRSDVILTLAATEILS